MSEFKAPYKWAFFLRLVSFERRRESRKFVSNLRLLGVRVWTHIEYVDL